METLYSQVNHFQRDDDRAMRAGVRDREMCGDGRARDCVAHCDNAWPSSATSRAPSQTIHS